MSDVKLSVKNVTAKLSGMVSRGIKSVYVDAEGHLIFVLTNGSTLDVGVIDGAGTTDHTFLNNRDAVDQHPMSAITGLEEALEEAGRGSVAAHNTDTSAHNDLRIILQELADRINAALDSDDETLDELSEIVEYIKSNKSLIDAITTSKVSVSDIIDNLVTNVANKPLSAAQGVALKALVDAINYTSLGTVPIANGGTGATTAAAARVNLGVPSLARAGTVINSGSLDDYTTAGEYYVLSSTYAKAITNSPITSGGYRLWVVQNYSTSQYIQIALSYTNQLFMRQYHSGAWHDWITIGDKYILDSTQYGTSLPTAGTAGRIFFKKA